MEGLPKSIEKAIMEDEEDFEELEEELNEESELYETSTKSLMSEEEFFERIDEFEERSHGLTLLIDRALSLLGRYAKKNGVDMDLELWEEVAKPSLNVGFWYYEKVKGERLMVSYPQLSLLIGAAALVFVALGTIRKVKEKKKEKTEKPVKTEKEKIKEEVEKKKEEAKKEEKEEKDKAGLSKTALERLNKNLGS